MGIQHGIISEDSTTPNRNIDTTIQIHRHSVREAPVTQFRV
jgi:hypothetical protein